MKTQKIVCLSLVFTGYQRLLTSFQAYEFFTASTVLKENGDINMGNYIMNMITLIRGSNFFQKYSCDFVYLFVYILLFLFSLIQLFTSSLHLVIYIYFSSYSFIVCVCVCAKENK